MRITQRVLFAAIAVLGLAVSAQAAPTVVLGNYDLLPNTPGQSIPLYVTGILPNGGPQNPNFPGNVNGILLSVAIADGGVPYGGTPGPTISSVDVDSGPTIWTVPSSPAGHQPPAEFYDGQLAQVGFLTNSGWVNVTGGLFATLVVDTTGFNAGIFPLTLSGGAVEDNLGNTEFTGNLPSGTSFIYQYFDGTAGQITIVPEPSSVVLAAIGLIGLAAWGWRRRKRDGRLEQAITWRTLMRNIQFVLFTAIAVLGLGVSAQAAPTVTLGNYDLLPNTPGQSIPLYVTGIVPNAGPNIPNFPGNVNGIVLTVGIADGGVSYGGMPGPTITSIDVDSGPTIWTVPSSPAGHQPPNVFYDGQLAQNDFLTNSGWVNVTGGLFATLVVDTTGFSSGTYPLTLSGGNVEANLGNTEFTGPNTTAIVYQYFDGTAGQITIVPEPSSVVLAALGLIGLAAWGWRRRKR